MSKQFFIILLILSFVLATVGAVTKIMKTNNPFTDTLLLGGTVIWLFVCFYAIYQTIFLKTQNK